MAALLLAEANNMEARIQQRDAGWAKHHGGTSGEHGHWCNFRRISYYGAKWDVIDLPLLFGRALLRRVDDRVGCWTRQVLRASLLRYSLHVTYLSQDADAVL